VADGCNICIITDIAQGPGGILYITSNDPTVMRFNVATQSFETPVQMPNTNALGGNLAVSATDVWITDFNNDVVWHYHLSDGEEPPGRRCSSSGSPGARETTRPPRTPPPSRRS
jgi:hypothetical protein